MDKYNEKVQEIVIEQDSKEFYGIVNTKCPICKKPNNIVPMPIVKLGDTGYCLDCYYEIILKGNH